MVKYGESCEDGTRSNVPDSIQLNSVQTFMAKEGLKREVEKKGDKASM